MTKVLLILIMFLGVQDAGEGLVLKSASLGRQDMPDHFPYQLLSEGFAVLRITLQNNSKSEWTVNVDDLEVYSKKGKRMKRALPTDITPKILKYYTGITGYSGHPEERTVREEMYGEKVVGVRTGQPIVSLDTVEGLRGVLESYQLQEARLAPGESTEAFYYLESKDSGSRLSGGWLVLKEKRAEF